MDAWYTFFTGAPSAEFAIAATPTAIPSMARYSFAPPLGDQRALNALILSTLLPDVRVRGWCSPPPLRGEHQRPTECRRSGRETKESGDPLPTPRAVQRAR